MSLYAVALKDPAAPTLGAAGFLAGVKGFNRDSAKEHLRRQPGFLGRSLAMAAAEELRAAAAAAGFEAMLVCEDAVPVPPIAVKPVKIEFKGSGFDFTAGLIEFIPYEAVTIFSAGVFDAPVQPLNTDALRDNVFFKLRSRLPGPPPLPEPRTAKETFFRADLIADGGRLRLLLEPENLDFSALGAERSHSSLVNFRTLLGKLAAPTFNAVKNGLLAAFLAGQPLANLKFASAAACDAELSRLLLIKTGR